jgi:bacterioferritin-associated ferredoxin
MYICVCNAIKADELREAAHHCPGDAEKVYGFLGCAPQCRQCLDEADDIVHHARKAEKLPILMHH